MKVFLTGASGFIGRALSTALQARGDEVAGVDLVADPARGVVAGDVSRAGAWQDAATGCGLFVHTAAIVSLRRGGADEVWRANVVGTANALEAAARAGAERFVHFSSVTVFGSDFPDGVDETAPVKPSQIPYPDTKIASELVALQAHVDGRVPVTIVRPGDVHGPGSRAWAVLPVELIRSRRFVLPDGGRGVFSPVFIDDLVAGVLRAAAAPAATGQTFTLSGGEGVSNRDFFGGYADALGTSIPRVPARVAVVGAGLVDRLDRSGTSEINAASTAYMLRRGTYSIAKARGVLGWSPQVGWREGQAQAIEWLRAEGHIE